MNHEGHEEARKARKEDVRRRKELREAIEEGCREMADVMLEIEREWEPLSEEVWRNYADGV